MFYVIADAFVTAASFIFTNRLFEARKRNKRRKGTIRHTTRYNKEMIVQYNQRRTAQHAVTPQQPHYDNDPFIH